jgi:hypothetical protein
MAAICTYNCDQTTTTATFFISYDTVATNAPQYIYFSNQKPVFKDETILVTCPEDFMRWRRSKTQHHFARSKTWYASPKYPCPIVRPVVKVIKIPGSNFRNKRRMYVQGLRK